MDVLLRNGVSRKYLGRPVGHHRTVCTGCLGFCAGCFAGSGAQLPSLVAFIGQCCSAEYVLGRQHTAGSELAPNMLGVRLSDLCGSSWFKHADQSVLPCSAMLTDPLHCRRRRMHC